jgi:hypothetical protein
MNVMWYVVFGDGVRYRWYVGMMVGTGNCTVLDIVTLTLK